MMPKIIEDIICGFIYFPKELFHFTSRKILSRDRSRPIPTKGSLDKTKDLYQKIFSGFILKGRLKVTIINEKDSLNEIFIFETTQLLDKLEQLMLELENDSDSLVKVIPEVFRVMHTIKGSAAMMGFENIANLAHAIEDFFFYLREEGLTTTGAVKIEETLLQSIDFIKNELNKLANQVEMDGDSESLIQMIRVALNQLQQMHGTKSGLKVKDILPTQENSLTKGEFQAVVFFEKNCDMEEMRAASLLENLKSIAREIDYLPRDLMEDSAGEIIRNSGLKLAFDSELPEADVQEFLLQVPFVKEVKLKRVSQVVTVSDKVEKSEKQSKDNNVNTVNQSMISVNLKKLDLLLDQVSELVISEAILKHNLSLSGIASKYYQAEMHRLEMISKELQDTVMSLRMLPLRPTFQKMQRLVRDVSKKLNKELHLRLIGEETEVDRIIIENISDPLMHLIRNAADHGLEETAERLAAGKSATGEIILEARSVGSEVWIVVKDDGRGLNREKILKKARERGLIRRPESELSEREIYSFILMPGFSTKEEVTEYSGRGVGMDVVSQNIEKIGGAVLIDSIPNHGTTISLKIPLTLSVIEGMLVEAGGSIYTIPTMAIKETFQAESNKIFATPDGTEMVVLHEECYPIFRLQSLNVKKGEVAKNYDGIFILVESESGGKCLYTDRLIGQEQVVVKSMPKYLKKVRGISGCTILGNGDISLILDVTELNS